PALVPELVEADLAASEERLRRGLALLWELDREDGRDLRLREEPHEALRGEGLLELPHAEVLQGRDRVDYDPVVPPLDEQGLQELLEGVDGDLVALEVRGLPDVVVDLPHPRGLHLRADLDHRRRLEPPDIAVPVEDL